jgi:hypothetical protein
VGLEFDVFKLHCKLVQQQAAIMAAASAAGGGAYIGAAPMAIATQIPPSALNGIASPGVVPSAQGPFQLFFNLISFFFYSTCSTFTVEMIIV